MTVLVKAAAHSEAGMLSTAPTEPSSTDPSPPPRNSWPATGCGRSRTWTPRWPGPGAARIRFPSAASSRPGPCTRRPTCLDTRDTVGPGFMRAGGDRLPRGDRIPHGARWSVCGSGRTGPEPDTPFRSHWGVAFLRNAGARVNTPGRAAVVRAASKPGKAIDHTASGAGRGRSVVIGASPARCRTPRRQDGPQDPDAVGARSGRSDLRCAGPAEALQRRQSVRKGLPGDCPARRSPAPQPDLSAPRAARAARR